MWLKPFVSRNNGCDDDAGAPVRVRAGIVDPEVAELRFWTGESPVPTLYFVRVKVPCSRISFEAPPTRMVKSPGSALQSFLFTS